MVMSVEPGGAYFGFYSDYLDVERGEVVSYADAVASVAAPGARDVADLSIPGSIGNPNILGTHPKVIYFTGDASFMELLTTYDNGYWGDFDGSPFSASFFLVELQGPGVAGFQMGQDIPLGISHYVSQDGGQSIYLSSSSETLFDAATRMKVWRAVVFPGDPLPGPPTKFWTRLLGAREIV